MSRATPFSMSQRYPSNTDPACIYMRTPLLTAALAVSSIIGVVAAQEPVPSLDVTSVKESTGSRVPLHWEGARVAAAGVPLQTLLVAAYGPSFDDLRGLPEWARTARWEISAIASRPPTSSEQPLLLRTLLATRFGVVAREVTEVREVYTLRTADYGQAKPTGLTRSTVDCADRNEAASIAAYREGLCTIALSPATGIYSVTGVTMASLSSALRTLLQRPVVDQTGLTDLFDIDLRFRPMGASTANGDDDTLPDLVTAVREQLHLNLESARAPVTFTVFDHVERPLPN